MPRIDHNQTWDRDGNLIHEEFVEVPDSPKTVEELTAEIAHLRDTLDAVSKAGTFDAARTAITQKMEETKSAGATIEIDIGG